MRATCCLILFSLLSSGSSYADSSSDERRDKIVREIETCLRHGGVSSWSCRHQNENIKALTDIYRQGDKTVLPTLLRITYLTDFYGEALVSDPDGFLNAASQLSERDRQGVALGMSGAVNGLSRQRFDAIRADLLKVPDSSPNYQVARMCLLTLERENAAFLVNYFPPAESGGPTPSLAWWFSRDLYALKEKPLWPPSAANEPMYRVTVFPAFTFPRSVTLTVMPDQTGQIRFRATDAQRHNISVDSTQTISSQEVAGLTEALTRIQFWQLPTNAPQLGLDGADFILEGVQEGKYHIVVRWCPGNTPFGKTVRDLFHFADPKFAGC
jgi:hypothetical protein